MSRTILAVTLLLTTITSGMAEGLMGKPRVTPIACSASECKDGANQCRQSCASQPDQSKCQVQCSMLERECLKACGG